MTAPRLSIITPVKNGAQYFQECLDSIDRVRAAGISLEHIVVDAESTDGTLDMITSHGDTRIFNEPALNATAAMQFALKQASADYVTFLMSDDRLAPGFGDLFTANLKQRPDCDLAVFACELFGEGWSRVAGAPDRLWNILAKYHGQNSMIVRRDLFAKIAFPLRYRLSNDRMMSLLLFRAAQNLHLSKEVLASLRTHPGSQGNQVGGNDWEIHGELVRIGHEMFDWNASGAGAPFFAFNVWRRYIGANLDKGRLGPGPRVVAPPLSSAALVAPGWAQVKSKADRFKPRAGSPGYFDPPFDYVAEGPPSARAAITYEDMRAGKGLKRPVP